jgi:hypothetical protein
MLRVRRNMAVSMLTIRTPQLAAMLHAPREAYLTRLEKNVRSLLPAQVFTLGDAAVREIVRKAAAGAESLGFATERDVANVVNLYFLLGPDFEDDPEKEWVVDALGDAATPPASRIENVYARLGRERGEAPVQP